MHRALKCQNRKCESIFYEKRAVVQKITDWDGTREILVCPDCGNNYMVEVDICVACATVDFLTEAEYDEELCDECIYALDQQALEKEVREAERLGDSLLESVVSAAREHV